MQRVQVQVQVPAVCTDHPRHDALLVDRHMQPSVYLVATARWSPVARLAEARNSLAEAPDEVTSGRDLR